jgi:glycosyltransferase involved in cell wall biosynthesis
MKLAIITHVAHIWNEKAYFGYSAYVREMNIWGKYATQLLIAAPLTKETPSKIHLPYTHTHIKLTKIPFISITSFSETIRSLVLIPVLVFRIWKVMLAADHIHLRCPGSIALIGCFVQVFFPKKPKTAKYAGNWDPKAKQPLSYRIQKWILSNTFLTRNIKVLAYGDWPNQSKNIIPFFTASYSKTKISGLANRSFESPFTFVFAGILSVGKRPLYAIQLVELLEKREIDCRLDFYGEGTERNALETYISENKLGHFIRLHGNETAATVEEAYKKIDFLILPSQSEGWPKVVAEAMFFGCIPIATRISCVPWMLGEGDRGILLSRELEADVDLLSSLIAEERILTEMSKKAQVWSQGYTLDKFEEEIQRFLL